MFLKLNSLQKQVDILMIAHYNATYNEMNNLHHENIAEAAVADNIADLNQDNPERGLSQTHKDKDSFVLKDVREDIKSIKKESNTSEDIGSEEQFGSAEDKSKQEFANKKVYLTFDDGPSKYTDDILDILSEYNVKATFFVIGKTDDSSKEMYQRIVEEGHTLGMHSYSHDYKYIYKSLEDFDKDFTKVRDLLYDTTGYLPTLYRFPGGSSNNVSDVDISSFIQYLNDSSVTYFDWNVVSGDATGKDLTQNALYNNVINGVKKHNTSVVLMHDTDVKVNSVKSLKRILDTLIEEGAVILPLDENVTPIQQVKSSSFEQ
jgi:peptidoglycan/xylan/chitin deacetylase (PgdA/CDA1 family)